MNANDGAKYGASDKKLDTTTATSVKPKFLIADEGRRSFKWSFSRENKNIKSKDFQQKHGPQNRAHPYGQLHENKQPQLSKSGWEFLPPKEVRTTNPAREKNEADKLANYKLKNPGPTAKQIMQLEREAIELRKQRSVDLSRGLMSLEQATTKERKEDMTPRDADDDQYHKRLADRSKVQRKNYSAMFMKAFFEEANAIAMRGGPDKMIDKQKKRKATKHKTATRDKEVAKLTDHPVEKFVASGQDKTDH